MLRTLILGLGLGLGLGLLEGCDQAPTTGPDPAPQALEPQLKAAELDLNLCSPTRGGFTLVSTNPYFPLEVGRQWLLEGEENGALIELLITVRRKTEVVAGVTTRVVEERESADGELVEVSRNFYVEASDGTVCYYGEEVDIYENGKIVSHEGAWRADDPGNRPGIIMPADPQPGVKYQMEDAPGVAQDQGEIIGTGSVTVPAGTFTETIRVREFNPLDGDKGYKVFAAGVGLVIDGVVELVSF